jgi:hypothetical protein
MAVDGGQLLLLLLLLLLLSSSSLLLVVVVPDAILKILSNRSLGDRQRARVYVHM